MRAKKCDRCDKLYEHYDGSKEFKNTERANDSERASMKCVPTPI